MTRAEAWAMFATQALGVLTSTPLVSEVRVDNVRGAAKWADELLVEFDKRFPNPDASSVRIDNKDPST